MIINKKGNFDGIIVIMSLLVAWLFGCYTLTEIKNEYAKNREDMVAKYSPNELYKNKFSEIKPLSTKDYVVKIENSDVENEKYVRVRVSADNFKKEDVYVIQKRDDDSFEIIRKYENFEPLK